MRDVRPDDMARINAWHVARGQKPMAPEMVPALGAIEPEVAAGFLFKTDATGIAYMDLFVTNPDAPLFARRNAIVDATQWLVDRAREDGIKHIVALTHLRSLARIGKELGFHDGGMYRAMIKEIA